MHTPTVRRQGRNLLLLLGSLLFLVQVTDAQRVIASLGTRLKNLHNNRSGSKKANGKYTVQGEENERPTFFESFESFAQESNTELFVAGLVLMITIYLLSFRSMTKSQKEDGESVSLSTRRMRHIHFLFRLVQNYMFCKQLMRGANVPFCERFNTL
jgi:hypothetical protein